MNTSKHDKDFFYFQVSCCVYATNLLLSCANHPEFRKIVLNIRLGYKPPNPHEIGDIFLDKMHKFVMEIFQNCLRGQTVCAAFHEWSNIHNESIERIAVPCKG